jgi:hypothetical protein
VLGFGLVHLVLELGFQLVFVLVLLHGRHGGSLLRDGDAFA